jgi:hypothetical protein
MAVPLDGRATAGGASGRAPEEALKVLGDTRLHTVTPLAVLPGRARG